MIIHISALELTGGILLAQINLRESSECLFNSFSASLQRFLHIKRIFEKLVLFPHHACRVASTASGHDANYLEKQAPTLRQGSVCVWPRQ